MKITSLAKYISISGIIIMIMGALLKTGEEGTSIVVVLISSLLFVAASIKTENFPKE